MVKVGRKKKKQIEGVNEQRKRMNEEKSTKANAYTCNICHTELSKIFNDVRHKTRIHI